MARSGGTLQHMIFLLHSTLRRAKYHSSLYYMPPPIFAKVFHHFRPLVVKGNLVLILFRNVVHQLAWIGVHPKDALHRSGG